MLNGRYFTTEDYDNELRPITKFVFDTLISNGVYNKSNIIWSKGVIYVLWKPFFNLGLPMYVVAFNESRNKRKC